MNEADVVFDKQLERYWLRALTDVRVAEPLQSVAPEASTAAPCATAPIPRVLLDRALAASQGAELGLFVLVAAAAAGVLRRAHVDDPVTVGTVAFDGVAPGPAGNPLLVHVRVGLASTFSALVQAMKAQVLAAIEHQSYAFTALLDKLRDRGEVLAPACFELALASRALQSDTASLGRFGVVMTLVRRGDEAALELACGHGRDRVRAERFARSVLALLASGLARPHLPLAALRLLDADGEAELTTIYNHRPSVPSFHAVHQRVDAQARQTPDATAVVGEDGVLTHAGLRRRSDALAAALVAAGVRPEDVVAVRTPYATSLAVAALGVLKAGAAFVLLDGGMPEVRLEQLLHDSRAVAMVLAGGQAAPPSFTGPVVTLEDVPAAAAPHVEVHPRSLAYLIYSSGSTGRPKGAMVEHGSFADFTQWAVREYGHREGRRCLLSSAVAYDGTILQLFPPLVTGGVVHVIDPRARLEIPHYVRFLVERQIACIDEVPSLLRVMCAYLRSSGHGPLASLEVLSVGGEAIAIELVRECRRWITATGAIVNGYSPSETSPIVLTHRFDGTRDDEISLLGAPRPNAQVLVLDAYDQPLPPAFTGELHVAGLAVSRGYRDRPALTAERFVPSVCSDGGRMYRSGDRARWLEGGLVEFLGRSDRQIKVRGHRVELDEIEVVLREQPEVAAAAVTLDRDEVGSGRVVAYVVPAPTTRPELWPSLGEHLVYDDLVYQAMTNDLERNRKYAVAMRRHVPGKVVVDVGTGKDAVLAILCVEAGARRVYAIETLEHAFVAAKERVRQLGLDDRITVLHGDARTIVLPEPVHVCVSEVFGGIGGCEGAAAILGDARRLLAPGGVVIPERSITRIAAASLPPELHEDPRFSPLAAAYVEKIFARVGRPFDVPVGIRGFSPALVASGSAVFEDLDFRGPVSRTYARDVELCVTTPARIDGFVLWLELETTPGEVIDTLHRQHCWMPTFFPVFYPGVEVAAGDHITATCRGTPSSDGVAMDYRIEGRLHRHGHAPLSFEHDCRPYEGRHRGSPFHTRLFAQGPPPPRHPAESLGRRLRDALVRRLPGFMVPDLFVELDALPMLASGKVNYPALPAPPSREQRAIGFVAPRTPTELAVAAIWAELLRLDEVGVTEDFFRCGGHSLVATQLASRLREAFHVEWSVRDVFERPTIAAQAELLEQAVAPAPAPPVTRRRATGHPPASFAQERLWFLSQLDPASPFYTAAAMLTLRGHLDVPALERALGMLIRRHESLRTSFAVEDGRPVQVIAAPRELAMERVRCTNAQLAELVRKRVGRPFDLGVAPLVRGTLFALDDADHRLLITLHHIICDGWSVGILARELAASYAHVVAGGPGPLGELRLQYADYAAWQRQAHEAGHFDAQRDYWRQQLAGAPSRLELPTDRPRPRVLRHEGATRPVRVPAEVAGALARLGEREGATLFMVVLAAFGVLLRRYCPQTDIVVGFPIANRHRGELEELIGLFANTLVLRMDLARDRSFRTLVQQARRAALDAYAHQDLPFESLLQELHVERDLGFQPLFQVALVMHDTPMPQIELPGLSVVVEELDTGTAKFDLCLELAVDGDALTGKLEYSTELFDASTIERIASNLSVLLAACAADPERGILTLPVSTPAERALLTEWNRTTSVTAREASLSHMFAAQVAQRPDAVAVVDRDEHVSYRALALRVDRLARRLARLGVGPEVVVAVSMERSVGAVVGVLAVVELGAAFVCLDSTLPRERLAHVVRETAPRVVLTQRGLASLEGYAGEVVLVDEPLADGHGFADPHPRSRERVRGDGLAYIVYTSGTTGRPKGIAMTHASLANEIAWQLDQSPSGRPLRTLQLASLGFDIAYLEIFSTLAEGGTLLLVPEATRRDPQATLAAMLELGVERAVATYAMLQPLASAAVGRGELPWLRELVSTGEDLRITPEIAALCEANPRLALGNYYGPSECDVVTSFWVRERPVPTGSVPIGRPITNTRIHLLDGGLAPVPIGATGEVWIGGTCVGRGYLGQPGATAERFRPDPFGIEAGARLYRTGDLARHLADGNVRYFGRIDRQIKIRGVRIEPGEIEVALVEHDAVCEAFVTTHAGASGRLVAYVVLHAGAALDERQLADHLRARVPHTMVPARYVALERLPLDANGKVDWKRLPAPTRVEARAAGSYAPPRTAIEAAIAEVWREVLQVERIGRDDNFFDLGGDSLRIARVHAKLVAALGVELTIVELFQHPTLDALAELLARRAGGAEPTAALPPPRAEVRRELAEGRDAARARRRAGRVKLDVNPRGKRTK